MAKDVLAAGGRRAIFGSAGVSKTRAEWDSMFEPDNAEIASDTPSDPSVEPSSESGELTADIQRMILRFNKG